MEDLRSILRSVILDNDKDLLQKLKISDDNKKKLIIAALKEDDIDFCSTLLMNFKINANFGNNHCGDINPLIYAVWKGQFAHVDILLSCGADPNIITPRGTNAVHYALENDNLDLAIHLVANGAKVDNGEQYGITFVMTNNKNATSCYIAIENLYRIEFKKQKNIILCDSQIFVMNEMKKQVIEKIKIGNCDIKSIATAIKQIVFYCYE